MDMNVKDTSELNKIHSTIHDKILNFVSGTNHYYTGSWEAIEYIRKNFPSCSYWHMDHVIIVWCERNFGNNWLWDLSTVYFKYERDKVAFLLRWS